MKRVAREVIVMRRVACLVVLLLVSATVSAQEPPPPTPVMDRAITGSLVATGILAMLEIGGTEAGIQQGTISEANRFQPDGKDAGATAGRMLIKGAGTAASVVIIHRMRKKHPRLALASAIGIAAFNGWLSANAFDHLRRGQR